MNGSETLMAVCSWLRLRCAARLLASLRWRCSRCGSRSGLAFLIALALLAAALALSVLALTVLALPALAVSFARRQVGGGRLIGLADDHLGAVGQVGEASRHHAIRRRQAA